VIDFNALTFLDPAGFSSPPNFCVASELPRNLMQFIAYEKAQKVDGETDTIFGR